MSETTLAGPFTHSNLFIDAEGALAEYLCSAEPLGMTVERALQLCDLHSGHSPRCRVLAVAELHLP